MISVDTNLLLYAVNADAPQHVEAYEWLSALKREDDVVISEFVLVELYRLLRNPRVLSQPLNAIDAAAVVQAYRNHPKWRLVGWPTESRPLHDAMWSISGQPGFAFRRIFDVRTALTLQAQGVTDLATTNVKDFIDLGFRRVWDPLA